MIQIINTWNAPEFYINHVNTYILKLIKKISKKLSVLHYHKIIPSTQYSIFELVDMILLLLMNTKYIYSINEVQKRKKFAFALYNILSMYI